MTGKGRKKYLITRDDDMRSHSGNSIKMLERCELEMGMEMCFARTMTESVSRRVGWAILYRIHVKG